MDLFTDKHVAHVATKNPDGTLQISIVWIDYDEDREQVVFNTARGRKKDRNIEEGVPIALSIQDTNNFYRFISIQGTVVEKTEEGARDHINKLSKKYFGRDVYDGPEDETRIKIYIKPRHVNTGGN